MKIIEGWLATGLCTDAQFVSNRVSAPRLWPVIPGSLARRSIGRATPGRPTELFQPERPSTSAPLGSKQCFFTNLGGRDLPPRAKPRCAKTSASVPTKTSDEISKCVGLRCSSHTSDVVVASFLNGERHDPWGQARRRYSPGPEKNGRGSVAAAHGSSTPASPAPHRR